MTDVGLKEIAQEHGVSTETARRWASDPTFPGPVNAQARRDRRWRISEVQAWQRDTETIRRVSSWTKARYIRQSGVHESVKDLASLVVKHINDSRMPLNERAQLAQDFEKTKGDGKSLSTRELAHVTKLSEALAERRRMLGPPNGDGFTPPTEALLLPNEQFIDYVVAAVREGRLSVAGAHRTIANSVALVLEFLADTKEPDSNVAARLQGFAKQLIESGKLPPEPWNELPAEYHRKLLGYFDGARTLANKLRTCAQEQ